MAKSKKGFAGMTPELRRELAQLGGIVAQGTGRGHRWNRETGKAAYDKGLGRKFAKKRSSKS